MTDDLVKRLRAWAEPVTLGYEVPAAGQVLFDAADRIEQQERYLAEAQKCLDAGDYEGAVIICRAALGKEEDKYDGWR
jgi:hypothetical protein